MALYSPIWGIGVFVAAFAGAIGLLTVSAYCQSISRSGIVATPVSTRCVDIWR